MVSFARAGAADIAMNAAKLTIFRMMPSPVDPGDYRRPQSTVNVDISIKGLQHNALPCMDSPCPIRNA
jgi:hypothetical protein